MSEVTKTAEEAPETSGITLRGYARWYDLFDTITFGWTNRLRKAAVKAAAPQAGEAVLDVGCGTGTLAVLLEERVGPHGRVEGIDASPEMIAQARKKIAKKGARAHLQLALAEDLPFSDGEFDLVTSTLVFHHFPDDLKSQALAEISRVLKPGGRLLIVDLAVGGHSLMGHLMTLFGGHAHGDYVGRLKSMIEEAGLANVEELKPKKHKSAAFIRATTGAA